MRFWSPRLVQELPRRRQKWSKRGRERAQIDPRVAQEPPRASHKPFKLGFRAVLAAKWGPPGARELSGGLHEPILDVPRDDFPPPGEPFFMFFEAPGCIFKVPQLTVHTTVLFAKLMQAYVQHPSTRLCNYYRWNHFYMWISTATDSRSIDREVLIHVLADK